MVRSLSVSVVVGFALLLAGCKDTMESLSKETNSVMQDVVAALKDVKDESSSKAAASKITALNDKMKDIQKRMAALEKPTAEEQKKAEEWMKTSGFEKTFGELMQESMRIATTPKLMTPELSKAMDGMDGGGGHKGGNPFGK